MRKLLFLALFLPLAFAECAFDASFGRVICSEVKPSNPTGIWEHNIAQTMKNQAMIDKGYIPTMQGWMLPIVYIDKLPEKEPVPMAENKTISNIKPVAVCVPAGEKEWQAWCWQMFNSPDKVDCNAVSKENKAQLLKNMRGC